MGVTDAERYLFDLKGYLVVPKVLDTTMLKQLNRILDSGPPLEWLPELGGPFLDLLDHQRILPYLVEFVDERVRLDHAYGIQMEPGSPGLALHGSPEDRPRNAAWYYVRNGSISSGLTVVSFALTDVRAGAGGFVCIPGSHKANFECPYLDLSADRDVPWLTHVELSAGDAVIFTEALTHGSLDWAGPGIRRALFYKYTPGQTAWLSYRWTKEELAPLSTRQRAMVGDPGVIYFDGGMQRKPIEM